MRAVFALAVPLLALAACAGPNPASDGPDNQQVAQARQCERGESQTGSMLAKKVCGPPLSEEERRRLADEAANTFKPTRGGIPGGGGK
ncbi:hypothetical protein SAMN05216359_106146 [Roseateles sp. YR242]|uniref:hypothetical protein n=1 Tax=Roseateles sp. YR242 TaxID=1855305 RepID=UPI0008B53558|nr:hypothetical protein [Roseateles sp. YR242]SEL20636.1 hypothetical protein SAMN05216359_106146 [Roseateles sp. YR242]